MNYIATSPKTHTVWGFSLLLFFCFFVDRAAYYFQAAFTLLTIMLLLFVAYLSLSASCNQTFIYNLLFSNQQKKKMFVKMADFCLVFTFFAYYITFSFAGSR